MPETNSLVYHFSDTARLPWILKSGELRASENRIGGFPCDFLWATTNHRGDKTASVWTDAYREGLTRMVRFTLASTDFEGWPDILDRLPAWNSLHRLMLERSARNRGVSPTTWRCRCDPLPLDKVLAIDTKSHVGKWQPLATPIGVVTDFPDPDVLGVVIAGTLYWSKQYRRRDGARGYTIGDPIPVAIKDAA